MSLRKSSSQRVVRQTPSKYGRKELPSQPRFGSRGQVPLDQAKLGWLSKAIRARNQASTIALAEGADARFREIEADVGDLNATTRETKNDVESLRTEVGSLTEATNKVPQRFNLNTTFPQRSAPLNTFWKLSDADKELYSAIKFALKGHCAEIRARVPGGRGFELLRLLALKYDRLMPHLKQMLMASIYGPPNNTCKELEATVARFAYIHRFSYEVAEQTGKRQFDSVLDMDVCQAKCPRDPARCLCNGGVERK